MKLRNRELLKKNSSASNPTAADGVAGRMSHVLYSRKQEVPRMKFLSVAFSWIIGAAAPSTISNQQSLVPRVEFRRIENSKRQILVLTHSPGKIVPFETIADVIPVKKRLP